MTNDNNIIDDFDTQIHSDELYDGDIPCYECGGFTDNHLDDCPAVPTMEADYDDLAYEEDSGSPIDTDRMERESEWMYPSDLEGYECPEFDS